MDWNSSIPQDKSLDNTLNVLREGYYFIPHRCRHLQSDIFQTRLLGQKVFCMSGKDAAAFFYDKAWFTRKKAAPKRVQKTLFGVNGIQTMDGSAHEHRKLLFMSLMTEDRLTMLDNLVYAHWQARVGEWKNKKDVILFNEAEQVFCQAACDWAGVPIREEELPERARDFSNMIDAFGAVGPRHWQGRIARQRAEAWIRNVINDIRDGRLGTTEDSALYKMAFYRDTDGHFLSTQQAAVELINVLRPITAIATFLTFSALALHDHPESREMLKTDDNEAYYRFAQEVRRFYPFGPFLGARVRSGFIWNNRTFKKGTLVLLDLYGTNHDPRLWERPNEFQPDRFKDWNGGLFDLIPQGGGDYYTNHRCPGEWATVEAMKASLRFLVNDIRYDVPVQDLRYSMSRMPTLPKSKFIMTNVQPKTE
ncbi:cytochrome P450 [Bacillus piscicola]|uniref:cytochrome P450 n=1 Tax=Bacillus piscicola TaxID=1632684 RepID=UPI001F096C81|nr:cytochrome P450 [Bacillus piscicola]